MSSPAREPARTAGATLLHLLGDLVHPCQEAVPTSAFLTVLGGAGHEEAAARQALLRSARSGWIGAQRRGRETWWALTDRGVGLIADGLRRVADLGRDDGEWDGSWVVVLTTIPHERRAVRRRAQHYLEWSGFGSPAPGVWISPHRRNAEGAGYALRQFDLQGTSMCFVGSSVPIGMDEDELVARAWNHAGLREHYSELMDRHGDAARTHRTGPAATSALLDLDAALRVLPRIDPQLPARLVPAGDVRGYARELLDVRSRLKARALPYWGSLGGGPESEDTGGSPT